MSELMELKNFAHMNTSNSVKLATWERGHRVENKSSHINDFELSRTESEN